MTNKWRWILMLWHDWRQAVWWAEMHLYPVESYHDIQVAPHRHRHAEAMYQFHCERASRYRHELFPPKPMTKEERELFLRRYHKRT